MNGQESIGEALAVLVALALSAIGVIMLGIMLS